MKELVFVGLGLQDEMGISLRGLEEVRRADSVFIELYTSLLPNFSLKHLVEICGKSIQVISRHDIEEESGKCVLQAADHGKTVLLVPGDPLIATTHVALRIEAEKRKIKTRVTHGASIISAVIGLSGLHNYKFGKTVTIPFMELGLSETPYDVVSQNVGLGLHTLCLLDIKADEKRYMSINEALDVLSMIEAKRKEEMIVPSRLAIGIARAGSNNPHVKAGFLEDLAKHDFGEPPHSLVFPGKLHFMEAEALVYLAGAPRGLLETDK
ncbi:MAG TPA: diphthine synthase [Candidatus Acidoferrum sp.]|nr:diphthine synthase [Candidatus Acidoferrum sp.]